MNMPYSGHKVYMGKDMILILRNELGDSWKEVNQARKSGLSRISESLFVLLLSFTTYFKLTTT